MGDMTTISTCGKCGLHYRESLIPHECAEWTRGRKEIAKEQPMNNHQVNQSGNCVIEGCPCRGWSAQITAAEDSRRQREASEPPAARGGGDEWRVERLPIHGSRIVDQAGGVIVPDCYREGTAEQIVTEHNQYHSLVAERERLIVAAKATVERLNDLPRFLEKNCTMSLGRMVAECLADLAVAIPPDQKRGAR